MPYRWKQYDMNCPPFSLNRRQRDRGMLLTIDYFPKGTSINDRDLKRPSAGATCRQRNFAQLTCADTGEFGLLAHWDIGPQMLRVVRYLPSTTGTKGFADAQWAGVGQASREETAGYSTVVGVDCRAMGI